MARKRVENCRHCNKEIHYITHKGETITFEAQVTRFVPVGAGDIECTGRYANKNDYHVFMENQTGKGAEDSANIPVPV